MWTNFVLFTILGMQISVTLAAVCDPLAVSYLIGKEIAIINMEAEEIHALKQSCNKPIILPGAVYTSLEVVTAEFGGNRAYLYNDNTGTSTVLVKDKMSIHYGTCQSMSSGNGIQVTTGMSKNFTSSEICIRIEPELNHRYLGGHTNGGKIQINVTVNLANCNHTKLDQTTHGTCKPLCDSQKELNNCGSSTTSHVLSTITTKPFLQTPNMYPTTRNIPISLTQTLQDSLTHTATLVPQTTSQVPLEHNTLPFFIRTSQPTFHKATIEKPTAIITSTTKSNTLHGTSPAFLQIPRSSASSEVVSLTGYSTSPTVLTRGFTYYTGLATSSSVSTTLRSKSSDTGTSTMSIAEAMFAVVGLLIVLLLVAVVAVFIRRRNTKSELSSLTYAGPQSTLHWRDNWLVRYHSNHLAVDATSEASEISCIHGNFALEEDSASLDVDQYVDNESIKLDTDENPYDNPWPLVVLDSDFVRNNKRLGKQRSNDRKESGDVGDNHREELAERQPASIADGNDVENDVKDIPVVATKGVQRKRCSSMSRYLKHIGSFSRGKYDVAKVERKNSMNEKVYQGIGSLRIARSKSTYRSTHESEEKDSSHRERRPSGSNSTYRSTHDSEKDTSSSYRERRPSSICSDCSQSQACKDILNDEIQDIQEAMETYDNNTGVVVDKEQEGPGKTQKGTKNKWRVSTLYAIISSNNGSTSKEVVLSRKPSYDKHRTKANTSTINDCLRNTDETGTRQHTTTDCVTDSNHQVRQLQKQQGQYGDQELFSLSMNYSSNQEHFERQIRLDHGVGDNENVLEDTNAFNNIELGNVANNSSTKPVLNVDAETKRTAFLSTRQIFEQNGSIKQDYHSHRITGTGQFPK